MICYRDMTFCSAACLTRDCHRQFTSEDQARADRWWGKTGAPVAFANFSGKCPKYAPKDGTTGRQLGPVEGGANRCRS